tara:strand:- start:10930 stop:11580 length:651 start_codon:yes stop_codon:yes gene_type:complete
MQSITGGFGHSERRRGLGFDEDKLQKEGIPVSSRFTEAMKVRKRGGAKQREKNRAMAKAYQDPGEWVTSPGFSTDAGTKHEKDFTNARNLGNVMHAKLGTEFDQRLKDAEHRQNVSSMQDQDFLNNLSYMQDRIDNRTALDNALLDAQARYQAAGLEAQSQYDRMMMQNQMDMYNLMQGNLRDMMGQFSGGFGGGIPGIPGIPGGDMGLGGGWGNI